jgi:uncharacterized protein YjbJ (UPF0337 family)
MNEQRFAGICLQFSGKLDQLLGELTRDSLRETAGRRDQIIGRARQTRGREQEQAAKQLREFQRHNHNWRF